MRRDESRHPRTARVGVPEVKVVARDRDAVDGFQRPAGAQHSTEHHPFGKHHHASVRNVRFHPSADHRQKSSIALIIGRRERRAARRMAVHLDDRQPFLGRAVEHWGDIRRRPRNLRGRAFGALIVGYALNLPHDQALASIARATPAQEQRHRLLSVAREEKALQVLVLITGQRKTDGHPHRSNSRASQSSIRKTCVPTLSTPALHGFCPVL